MILVSVFFVHTPILLDRLNMTESQFGLAMDDGMSAVLDIYLFFDGGHWVSCSISMVEESGQWSIEMLNLRLEDWSPEKLHQQSKFESRSVVMPSRLGS